MLKNYQTKLCALILFALLGVPKVFSIEQPEYVETTLTSESSIEEIRAELDSMNVYVLSFNLNEGEFPTYQPVMPPEGCLGMGITDNEYVMGSLSISYGGKEIYDSGEWVKKNSGVKLKMRGNTSTANPGSIKKSYKIKLEKKADLLFRDDKNLKDKEWVLLGLGSERIHFIPGFEVARTCGLAWEPEMRHVAVIINDQYMGTYYLTEAVGQGSHRVDVEDSGYIVENDAYWWIPDEVYFKSNHSPCAFGWTFKFPDTDDFDEMSLENIKWTINTVEQRLYDNEEVDEMVDYESFARWLIAHDIFNTSDPAGSNMYIKKRSFDPFKPFDTKIEMGPVWDLDDIFLKEEDSFSLIHNGEEFWYKKLVDSDMFSELYKNVWLEVRDIVKERALKKLEDYLEANPDLYKLRRIDEIRFLQSMPFEDPYRRYDELAEWFDKRIPVLNKLILGETGTSEIDKIEEQPAPSEGKEKAAYTLDGIRVADSGHGLRISIGEDGKASKVVR